nr:hypothetical protein [Tanacetum cinerariifolium]
MESVKKSIKSIKAKPKSESNQSKPGTDLERERKTKAEGVNILLGRLVPELMGRVNPICILDNRGRRVIPFAHFINNDLEYLRGSATSRKYTTSVTNTKAADYGNIKWIEDLGRGLQVTQNGEDSHVTLTPVNPDCPQESSSVSSFMTSMLNPTSDVKEQVSRILPRIEESVNAILEAEVLTRSSHSSRTTYAIAADLSEMELKKILIENMEGNKSIQRSDEQQNLYKALVEAYDADKAILDTYGESTILKRRREDDDQEGPFVGSDRGSKRQKEGGEHASTSIPSETGTGGAGRSTTGS